MDVRFLTDQQSFKRMTTDELRRMFLIDNLFVTDEIVTIYCDVDRSITGSAVPVGKTLKLTSSKKEMASDYFAERREIGIINIGGKGSTIVDGKEFPMQNKDALYVGRGSKEVSFTSLKKETPAQFYFVSYPAHKEYPTTQVKFSDAEPVKLGLLQNSNKRTIYKYIHPNGIKSSQLVMGLTELDEGSVWNTMPPHTHQRRSEVYLYYNVDPDALVFHFMGEPHETRHILIRDHQAVLNPSWSIHSGVATKNYSFIWAMGGENQVFDDMDSVEMKNIL